jgi:hypothetical protein
MDESCPCVHVLFPRQASRVSLADTDAALSRHLADITAYRAEFERVWQRVMAAIDVETERVQLRIDAVDSAHQSDLHALTSALAEAGRQCADARLAWTDEVEAPQQKAAELAAESALHEYEQRAAADEADEMRRGSEAVLACGALIATERVRHDTELRKRAFKQAVLQAANFADSKRTTAATLALDDRRLQDLQRLHAEVADSDRLLADSEAERRDEALRTRESVHQSELRRRALVDRLRETLRVSDAERQANVERQISTIRAATESMQSGLREVRSELYAAQQLHDDTEQRCAIEGQQAEVALRQEEQMRAVDVQVCGGVSRWLLVCVLCELRRVVCHCLPRAERDGRDASHHRGAAHLGRPARGRRGRVDGAIQQSGRAAAADGRCV